jgi:hypothetical protein
MANKGSYVTNPGGTANWAAGFADSLSNLSDSYRDQATTKKNSELAAEALAYNRGRDVLTDSRYDAEQKRITKERNALADGIKNYSSADARAEALARNPELAAYVDGIRADNMLTLDQNTIYNAMSDQVGPLSRDDLLKRSKGGTHMIMEDMPKNTALAISQGLADGSINEQDYLNAKKGVNKSIDDYVGSNMNLYRAEENSRILQNLVAAGADPAKAFAVAEGLSKQYSSKDELTKAALAAQKVAFTKSKYNADIAFKIYKEKNKDSKSSGVTKGNVDISDLNAHLEVLDPGWIDKGTLRNFWQYAVDNGVNSKIAMHAVDRSVFVDRGGIGINRTKEEFLQFSKGLEAANKSGGDKGKYDEFIAKEAAFVNPMLQNKRAFMGGLRDISTAPLTPNKYASGYNLPKPGEVASTATATAYGPSTNITGGEYLNGSRGLTAEQHLDNLVNGNTDVPTIVPEDLITSGVDTTITNPYMESTSQANNQLRDVLETGGRTVSDFFGLTISPEEKHNKRAIDVNNKNVNAEIMQVESSIDALPPMNISTLEQRQERRALESKIDTLDKSRDSFVPPVYTPFKMKPHAVNPVPTADPTVLVNTIVDDLGKAEGIVAHKSTEGGEDTMPYGLKAGMTDIDMSKFTDNGVVDYKAAATELVTKRISQLKVAIPKFDSMNSDLQNTLVSTVWNQGLGGTEKLQKALNFAFSGPKNKQSDRVRSALSNELLDAVSANDPVDGKLRPIGGLIQRKAIDYNKVAKSYGFPAIHSWELQAQNVTLKGVSYKEKVTYYDSLGGRIAVHRKQNSRHSDSKTNKGVM